MKVFHLNFSDIHGGAARAAYRIHHAVRAAGVDSTMLVNVAKSGDWTVEGPVSRSGKVMARIRPHAAAVHRALLRTGDPLIHSPAVTPSGWPRRLNRSNADVINLHWIAGEMLSIADIGHIKKPIVWTLHDMWAFCGAEHYTDEHRWREGYRRDNRPGFESGFDLNRWTWNRKRKHWRRPMHIVTPSRWLADCARESQLMRDWPIHLVPYPIDIENWKPVEQRLARELLGLPGNVPLLLFGAMGGGRSPRKGFDLLTTALDHLRGQMPDLELVVFGELVPRAAPNLGFPVRYAGPLHDDISLRVLYSAADVFALPSRQDNLPLTCMESLACGTPVVAFNSSGPPTMIEHQKTGFLAKAFDPADFAMGIKWLFEHPDRASLRKSSRQYAEDHFRPELVAQQYMEIYRRILA